MIQRLLSSQVALFTGILMMGTLAGCEALDKMEANEYRQQCQNLGIEPGSPHFDECMMQQQSLNENETEHSLDRIEREDEAKHRRR